MPQDSALTLCRDLDCNTAGAAPDWVQLMPAGEKVLGRDGRAWRLSRPDAVLTAFNGAGLDLAIDYEHQEDDPKRRTGNGPVPAAGWIKDLTYDPARGLMGRVDWTATARRMIEGREYRYLSPVFAHTSDGTITRLLGASLVHRPNLHLKALAREEPTTMTHSVQTQTGLARIAAALGLEPQADEAAILIAINSTQTPDPARFVPIEAVRELVAERAQFKATASEEIATARVEQAMNAGYLTPAMKSWAVSLCRADPDSFDSFMRSATPIYAHLFERRVRPAQNAQSIPRAGSTEEAAVFAQLGLDPNGEA